MPTSPLIQPRTLLLSVEEAADALRMSRSTLYDWIRTGKVPHRRLSGVVRFSPADLEQIVEDSARPATVAL